jgi:hypothetical protein
MEDLVQWRDSVPDVAISPRIAVAPDLLTRAG